MLISAVDETSFREWSRDPEAYKYNYYIWSRSHRSGAREMELRVVAGSTTLRSNGEIPRDLLSLSFRRTTVAVRLLSSRFWPHLRLFELEVWFSRCWKSTRRCPFISKLRFFLHFVNNETKRGLIISFVSVSDVPQSPWWTRTSYIICSTVSSFIL